MYGQIYNVLAEFQLKVKKEDKDSFGESLTAISKLSGHIQDVETKQEEYKETFKKDVAERVPKLDDEINALYEKAQDPKYLEGENMEKMFDILAELDEIEAKFKELEATKEKYNKWQEVLETSPTVFEHLDDCRDQMSLRCLMWRSLNEWQDLNEKWLKTQFSEVDAKGITTLAEKFAKNCMRLEKNLDPNPIQEKLKILVNQFKDAMPIVTALRNEKLEEHHWAQIKSLIKKEIDVSQSDFSLKSLIDMDVNQYQEEIVVIST